MGCLTEALGMSLSGSATVPAVDARRLRLAKKSGMQIMKLIEEDIRPNSIMVYEAFENVSELIWRWEDPQTLSFTSLRLHHN